MKVDEFAKQYETLCFSFNRDVNQGQMLTYYGFFKDYDINSFEKAIHLCIISNRFMPTISELIEAISPPDIGQAWERVLRVASSGCRHWVDLTDTDIATISVIGGMGQIQNATDESLHFICNDFKKNYSIMAKRNIRYLTNDQKLKDLNVDPESYKLLNRIIKPMKLEG